MMINADSILPYLTKKVRLTKSDASRHLLCTQCGKRTKLNRLSDGRRKCTVCGKKFRINKITERNKLRQCSQILLCFSLGFSEQQTAHVGNYRFAKVRQYFKNFRSLLLEEPQQTGTIQSFSVNEESAKGSQDPEILARKIIDRMPADFLSKW